MIQVEMDTSSIDAQVKKLYDFNEIALKHWRAALRESLPAVVASAKSNARSVFANPTGRTERAIKSDIKKVGSETNPGLSGRVGVMMDKDYYPNVVEYGRRKFAPFPGRFYMKRAGDERSKDVENKLSHAGDLITAELAIREAFNVA